ncbi:MAG: hypothetical protein HYY96_01225 [Candidatus Tectomicrobia bacterium]|nr:hypothetical protein [Candidatus Tectomicrobia bacterium]
MDTEASRDFPTDDAVRAAQALEPAVQRLRASFEALERALERVTGRGEQAASALVPMQQQQELLGRTAAAVAQQVTKQRDALGAYEQRLAAMRAPQQAAQRFDELQQSIEGVEEGTRTYAGAAAMASIEMRQLNDEQERGLGLLGAMQSLLGNIVNLLRNFGINVGGGVGRVLGSLSSVQGIFGAIGRLGGTGASPAFGSGGGGSAGVSPAFNLLGLGRSVGSLLGIGGGAAVSSAALGATPAFASGLAADAALSAGAGAAGAASILGPIGIAVGLGALAFSFFGKSGRAKELERQAKLLEESFAGLRGTLQGVNAGLAALAQGPLGGAAAGSLAGGLAGLPASIERFSGVTRNRLRLFGPTRELAGTVAEGVVSLLGGEAGVRAVATSGAFPASFFSGVVNRRFELPVGNEGIFSDAQLGKRADLQRSLFLSRLAGAGFEVTGATPFGREAPEHGLTAESLGAGSVVVQGLEQIAELFRVFASPGDLDRVRAFNEEFAQFLETLQKAAEGFTARTFAQAQGFAGVIEEVSATLFQLRPPTAQAQIKGALESFAAFSRVLAEGGAGAGPEGLQNIFEGLTSAATRFASVLDRLRQENTAASRAVEDLTRQQRLARADIEEQAFEASLRGLLPEEARAARLARLMGQRADIAVRLAAPNLQPDTALALVGQGRNVLQQLLELQSQNADLTIDEFSEGRNQMVAELKGLADISDAAFAAQIGAQQEIIDANQAVLAELGMGGSFVAAQEAVRAALESKLEEVRAIAAAGFNEQADLLRAIDTNTERLAQLGLIETRLGELNTLFAGRREPPTAAEIAQAARAELPDFSQLTLALGALAGFPTELSRVLDLAAQARLPSPQSLAAAQGAQGGLSARDQAIWEQIQNEARNLLTQGAGADVIGTFIRIRQQSLGFSGIPSFQEGGVMPRTGLAFLHAGEQVTPAGNGSRPAPINVEINDRQTIQLVTDGRVIAEVTRDHMKRLIIEMGRRGELFVDADGRINGS